jgi:hypothetical protein
MKPSGNYTKPKRNRDKTYFKTITKKGLTMDNKHVQAGNVRTLHPDRDAAAGDSLPTPSVWSASVGKIFPT